MAGDQKTLNQPDDEDVSRVIEAQGLYCPEPVMMLHSVVAELSSGEVLEIIATDPSTLRDIPKFCQFLGHELVKQEAKGDEYLFWIKVA
ncbi:MAG: sulfurtransferase TusA [Oleiphilus sp.]|nr:MAG: sulfurtransferase TusA [Oleiphilus sp.]